MLDADDMESELVVPEAPNCEMLERAPGKYPTHAVSLDDRIPGTDAELLWTTLYVSGNWNYIGILDVASTPSVETGVEMAVGIDQG